tara:strand:- start:17630 stop:19516 length:1887 start_codon:yes stop_codon:yes gene_type:complete
MRIINYIKKSVFGEESPSRKTNTVKIYNPNQPNTNVDEQNAMELTDVLIAVRVLAESIASLPLCLYSKQDDGGYKATNHPIYDIVRWQPNANQSSYDLRLWMMIDLLLRGNAVAQVLRDGTGNVRELYPLFANKIKYHIMPDGNLHYLYPDPEDEENELMLEQNEVLHIRLFADGYLLSPSIINMGSDLLSGGKSAEAYTREFYENASVVSGVISYPDEMSEETFQRLKEDWGQRYSGMGNRHRTPILEGGAKFSPMNLNHVESQMLESRKFTQQQIFALFKVPQHLGGNLDRATFSNIEHQNLAYVMHTLRPLAINFEQKLRMTLLSEAEKDNYYFKHHFNDLLRGDVTARFNAYAQAVNSGIMSPNDVRRKEDEPTYEGGDTYFVNGALMPVNEPRESAPEAMAKIVNETKSDKVTKEVEKGLKKKLEDHKEKVGDAPSKQTTLRKLKICFNRGIGAYKTNPDSVRPSVKSPEQWAYARVNSFLYALRNGRFRSGKHDLDLLPASHPAKADNYKKDDDEKKNLINKTYNDYPQSATNNAKRALKWLRENDNPNDCLTPVGFQRANQLANRESLSRDTIARMASFKRHQQNKDVPYDEGCGGIAWDCWGGTSGIEWAIKKLKQIDGE